MKFPISSMLLVVVGGLCFVIFIIFNYAYQNPDSGLFVMLMESANKTMNSNMVSWFSDIKDTIATGFGLTGVAMFGLAIIIYIADALRQPGSDF